MAFRPDIWIDFDASPRIVWVPSPSVSVTIQDLVDTIRVLEAEYYTYPAVMATAGKTFLYNDGVSDYYTGIVVTLLHAQVAFGARSGPAYTQCQVNAGNLVAQNAVGTPISPIYPTSFTQVVIAQATSPSLVVTSGGVGTPADVANAVWAENLAIYTTLGTAGNIISNISHTTTTIKANIANLQVTADTILAVTV